MKALLAAGALAALGCACAYGHGIGAELLPPQDAGGRSVSVEITGAKTEGDYQREFTFRALEAGSGEPIAHVTYQIRAVKSGSVVLDGTFEAPTGTLVVEMQDGPERLAESGGLFGFAGDKRVRVSGPHFGTGGLYSFDVALPAVGSELEAPPRWKGGVSLLDVKEISVPTAFGPQQIRHMSYYDTVERLWYSGGRVQFAMPFDGTPEAIGQTPTVHEEFRVSKEFGDMMVSELSAVVNGAPAPPGTVQIDDFADGYRTVHVVLGRDHLERLHELGILGSELEFSVGPAGDGLPFSTVTRNGQYRIVAELEPRRAAPGGELDISYRIEDVFIKDRPVSAAHRMYAESDGRRFFETDSVSRGDGGYDTAVVKIPDGARTVHVGFERIGGGSLAEARLPVAVAEAPIPGWVRGTVQLWAQGSVSDGEFAAAMGYLASLGVIAAEAPREAGAGGPMPGWMKDTAGLWARGDVPDAEFVAGIEYLMELGAIR